MHNSYGRWMKCDSRIVSLCSGINGHNFQAQTRNTPTGDFENNFIMSSSDNVRIIKKTSSDLNASMCSLLKSVVSCNSTLNVSGSSIFQNDKLLSQ